MEHFFQDLKYSLRTLRQQRAFTIAAVATLALGIGATTAVFSVVNAVLLRPFPFPDAGRIVLFMNTSPNGNSFPAASPAKFAHWRRQTDAVRDASAYRSVLVNYTGGDTPEQVTTEQVSPPFFHLLGATPALGRTFTTDEDLPTAGKVAVLSYGWWTRRFAADRAIVGKTISLSGEPYVVIGVIGKGFDQSDLGDTPDLWTMFPIDPNTQDQAHYFRVLGRLAPGVTLAQAQAKLAQSAAAYRERFPRLDRAEGGFSVEPMQKVFVRNSQSLLVVLMSAVAGVLLIACANVANLLLVRATVRKRELAIRAAMGADRGRIIRQLLTESVLLSIAGGAAGLTLGLVGIRSLMSINTANLPRLGDGGAAIQLDWRLAVFTIAVSIVTGLLFGVAPALQAARQDLSGTLRDGTGASAGRAQSSCAFDPRGGRDRARAGARDRLRTLDSHIAGTPRRRARVRRVERVDDDHVVHGSEVSDGDVRRASHSRRRRSLAHGLRCRARERFVLRAASRRVRPAVPRGRQGASRGTAVSRRRRLESPCRRDTSRCSRSRCFAAERSPIATTRTRLRWPSSTKRWRRRRGRTAIPSTIG